MGLGSTTIRSLRLPSQVLDSSTEVSALPVPIGEGLQVRGLCAATALHAFGRVTLH